MDAAHVIKFTKTAIDALPIPARGRVAYSDVSAPTGLRLRVTNTGAKAWYWFHRVNGRWLCSKIADYTDKTPDQAKAKARELAGDAANGVNPNARKREAREGAILNDLWNIYLETYAKPHKRASSVAEDGALYRRYLEKWASRRLTEIAQADVKTLKSRVGTESGPYAANRMLALLSTMFNKSGQDVGFDPRNNPVRGVPRFSEKGRDRVLFPDEIYRLAAAIKAESADVQDFIMISLYTGARLSNVLAMKWEDISMQRATWKIPGEVTKNGDPLVVSLAPEVIEILKKRPDASPFVFPARFVTPELLDHAKSLAGEGVWPQEIARRLGLSHTQVHRMLRPGYVVGVHKHMWAPVGAWKRVLKAAGITERTTFHDLRRTFATWLIRSGASLTVVAAAMGHKDIKTTQKHYAFAGLDVVQKATAAGVRAIAEAAKAPEDSPRSNVA